MNRQEILKFSKAARCRLNNTLFTFQDYHKYPSGKFIEDKELERNLKVIANKKDYGVPHFKSIFTYGKDVFGTAGDFFRALNTQPEVKIAPAKQVEMMKMPLKIFVLELEISKLEKNNQQAVLMLAQLKVIERTKAKDLVVKNLKGSFREIYRG